MCRTDKSKQTETPEAFMILVKPHLNALTTLIRFRISNSSDWDDILQNTLLCAWRALPKLRDRQSLKPWLLRICGNCCHMYLRSRIRRDKFHSTLKGEPVTFSHTATGRHYGDVLIEAQLEVQQLLDQLPETERRLMLDYYFKGLKVADIANQQNKPEGTIKRKLHSCRHQLRTLVENSCQNEKKGKNDEI